MHAEVSEAFELFEALIAEEDIDCDPQPGGHYYIAHRAKVMAALRNEAALLNETFGYGAKILTRDELHEGHVRDMEAAGALWEPDGTCIHAAKLAFGYVNMARRLGARIFYAMGYGGNGVMFSAQAGRRMAQLIAGQDIPDLPIFTSPLPSHGLLTPFRRLGQRIAYHWYHLNDEIL